MDAADTVENMVMKMNFSSFYFSLFKLYFRQFQMTVLIKMEKQIMRPIQVFLKSYYEIKLMLMQPVRFQQFQ